MTAAARMHKRNHPSASILPPCLSRSPDTSHRVDEEVLPGDERGLGAAEVRAQLAELRRVAERISAAVCSSASRPRATIVTFTPLRASNIAQPRPSPLLAAHTSAFFPLMPRSI